MIGCNREALITKCYIERVSGGNARKFNDLLNELTNSAEYLTQDRLISVPKMKECIHRIEYKLCITIENYAKTHKYAINCNFKVVCKNVFNVKLKQI